jgi:MFS family permease
MLNTLISIWALFAGIGLITMGSGLQGTLIGVRAGIEGFSILATGVVMSCYYGGFFLGSKLAPKLVSRVGHIRAFAAFTSLASATVLLHAVFLTPVIWGMIRVVTGFAYAGLFVVAESWLNDFSTNRIRGRLLSTYMAVQHGGFFCGQFFLSLGNPEGFNLFVLISVLLSVALIPILTTVTPAPPFEFYTPVHIRKLYEISPLGVFGAMGAGMGQGAFWGLGAVYAQKTGFSLLEISMFMASIILGGFVWQWPIGWLSDKFDRRKVLHGVSLAGAAMALICVVVSFYFKALLLIFTFCLGGLTLPLYPLILAHTNDHLSRPQMVGASSAMVMVYGFGAFLGPLTAAGIMRISGTEGYFYSQALFYAVIGGFAWYRMRQSAPVPLEEQGNFIQVPPRPSPVISVLTQPDAKPEAPVREPHAGSKEIEPENN